MEQIKGGMGKALPLHTIFRSLKYRNFRLFFAGQTISLIGTWIQRIALPWLVYDITHSAFLLGLVGFVGQIPTFLLAPFAGVITDRLEKRKLLMITQLLAMLQAFVLSFLVFSKTIEIWHIIVLSGILGCVNAFDSPARQSFVVRMVDKKDDIGNAIALNSTMVNSARLLGPSIAGILIALAGEGMCFLINGISYLMVIFSLVLMHVSEKKPPQLRRPVMRDLKEGFAYTFGFPPIKAILLLLSLVSLMGMPYSVLMPVLVKEVYHGNAHMFGFLMGASGLGALIGALFLASRRSIRGFDHMIPVSATIFGAGLILFSLSHQFLLSVMLMIITGLGMITQMAMSNTMLQTLVDDDKRGRVMSFYTMAFMGTAPFGSFMAGSLAKLIGAQTTILLGGIVCVAGAFVFARNLPVIKASMTAHHAQMESVAN